MNNEEVPIKKKRGRKPKNKTNEPVEIKVPKKRGRKPKPKPENEITEPKEYKKRGRKPKNKYSVTNLKTLEQSSVNNINNIILHLPISSALIYDEINDINNLSYDPNIMEEPKPFDPYDNNMNINFENINDKNEEIKDNENTNKKENNIETNKETNTIITETITNIKIINNENKQNNETTKYIESNDNKIFKRNILNIMFEFINGNNKNEWPSETNIHCIWCCHSFENVPCAIPVKYEKEKFYMKGCYCSFNCAAAFIFDIKNNKMWEEYSLLNLLYKKIYNIPNIKIKPAPSKYLLKIFGGYMDINEFRENFNQLTKVYKILFPPLISIIPQVEENILNKNKMLSNNKGLLENNKNLKFKKESDFNNKNKSLKQYLNIKTNN